MWERRWEALERRSNRYGERAVEAQLRGEHRWALTLANRAVRATRRLYRAHREDPDTVRIYAWKLRTRAEIRRSWTDVATSLGKAVTAGHQTRSGIADGRQAIELYKASGAVEHPVWIASMRLVIAELHAQLDEAEPATMEADLAIADYRTLPLTNEDDAVDVAHAFARYADIMETIGAHAEALEAHRESVATYRPYIGPDSQLWRDRHIRHRLSLSSPTLERFSRTAHRLAIGLGPPDADAAPEALHALQDATTGLAAVVPPRSYTGVGGDLANLSKAMDATPPWLEALGRRDLADDHRQIHQQLRDHGTGDVTSLSHLLRRIVDSALATTTAPGRDHDLARALARQANASWSTNRAEAAEAAWEALRLFRLWPAPLPASDQEAFGATALIVAKTSLDGGRDADAHTAIHDAVEQLRLCFQREPDDNTGSYAQSLAVLARYHERRGDIDQVRQSASEATTLLERAPAHTGRAETEQILADLQQRLRS